MKKITIVTACFNEEENVQLLYERVVKVFNENLSNYKYEHIFIDNDSSDRTVDILKDIAKEDKRIKIIVNSRNFGHIRSPFHALMQADGDAVISLVADLQDPPEMIVDLIKKWEEGYDSVIAIKRSSKENIFMFKLREFYYSILSSLSEIEIFKNFTGFGLYDKKVINALREMKDPYPFARSMIAEVGYKIAKIPYDQPIRYRGITKNNFYTLYDIAILGVISNSKVPLRLAIFIGIFFGIVSIMVGFGYFIMKLTHWDTMALGTAPLIIMSSFMFSVMLFFIGIIGEYVAAVYTQVLNRPLVFEKERVNFDINEED